MTGQETHRGMEEIRRTTSGAIDYAHYTQRGRSMRSLAAHNLARAARVSAVKWRRRCGHTFAMAVAYLARGLGEAAARPADLASSSR